MKTEKNIFIAFILNLAFSIFEFLGGIYTGSVAIMSDAVHDLGDAVSIGASYFLEKKSKRQPDNNYTYGYARYSVVGGIITSVTLLIGSVIVIYNAINTILAPVEIKYDSMIFFAVIGVIVNFCAAYITHKGDSLNQKAVNLHMLEDVLGWTVVLIGAVVMKFTNFSLIDPIMSTGVSLFILVNAIRNFRKIMVIFLENTPADIDIEEIKHHVQHIDDVIDVHHVHVWSIDGQHNYATMHIVTNANQHEIKDKIRKELHMRGICHVTLELETEEEFCLDKACNLQTAANAHHYHHHHH